MNTQKLINILEGKGHAVREAEGGSELVIACPLCFSEKDKLYISTEAGQWLCFQCEEKGHLRSLLIKVCEKTVNEAFELERELLGGTKMRKRPLVPRPSPPSAVELPKEFIPLGVGADFHGTNVAQQYLTGRGVDVALARGMGTGYCLTGWYGHRVIVPVVTQGALRTWVARSWLPGAKKKVLMPPGSQAERALFGYDRLAENRTDHLILTEGVLDAMIMWQRGYSETIATLGAHLTEIQRALVKRLAPHRVYLLRDGDAPGRKGAIRDARELACDLLPVSIALLPDGTDPASASQEDIERALHKARPVETEYGVETMKEVHR